MYCTVCTQPAAVPVGACTLKVCCTLYVVSDVNITHITYSIVTDVYVPGAKLAVDTIVSVTIVTGPTIAFTRLRHIDRSTNDSFVSIFVVLYKERAV